MMTVPQALQLAVQQHQAGQLAQAEQIYRAILQADPGQVDALHLLGVLAHQRGQHERAIAYLGQALQRKPDYAEAHNNLGIALKEHGQLEEAIACYRQAVRLKPDYAEAHNNLGVALHAQGQLEEAAACLQQALRLRPDYAKAHTNLGNVRKAQGQRAEAVAHYQEALRCQPDCAEAHNNLGVALHEQGQLAEARACLQQALRLRPDYAEAHNNRGNVLKDQGLLAEARACYHEALRCQPDDAEAHNNLGGVLKAQGQLAGAVACYQQALHSKPDFAEAHNNLGLALHDQGKLAEAVAHYQQALRCKPDYAEAYHSLGLALQDQGKLEEALAAYDQALRRKPDYAEAHWNRALTWLLAGNFAQGWPEYEWRWQCPGAAPLRFPQPLWDGSPLHGQTILLVAEQGLGDILHFIRYAPLVQARGGRVLVACPANLIPLLSRCGGIDQLIAVDSPLPPFDVYAPLLSLPRLFGTTLATIPAEVPYAFADAALSRRWREQLRCYQAFQIGIAWQGNPKHGRDRQRSIPLEQFAPLAQLPGVRLVSLQKGQGRDQLGAVAGRFAVTDLGGRLDEATGAFVETAAVMPNLDLVITSDTAIAHLAGALGVPVWVALSFAPDWRWLLAREDSPWYPTMRLFRQQTRGHWPEVFGRMADEVKQRLAQARAAGERSESSVR